MILIEKAEIIGFEQTICGMRNQMDSLDKSEFRKMITIYVDITAPLYWWREFDACPVQFPYKVGAVANSYSILDQIHEKRFDMSDFSTDHLHPTSYKCLFTTVKTLNDARDLYLRCECHNKKYYWRQIIQLLPSSYNQKRTIILTYEDLADIYKHCKNHELDEWKNFCKWIEGLPNSEIITAIGGVDNPHCTQTIQ